MSYILIIRLLFLLLLILETKAEGKHNGKKKNMKVKEVHVPHLIHYNHHYYTKHTHHHHHHHKHVKVETHSYEDKGESAVEPSHDQDNSASSTARVRRYKVARYGSKGKPGYIPGEGRGYHRHREGPYSKLFRSHAKKGSPTRYGSDYAKGHGHYRKYPHRKHKMTRPRDLQKSESKGAHMFSEPGHKPKPEHHGNVVRHPVNAYIEPKPYKQLPHQEPSQKGTDAELVESELKAEKLAQELFEENLRKQRKQKEMAQHQDVPDVDTGHHYGRKAKQQKLSRNRTRDHSREPAYVHVDDTNLGGSLAYAGSEAIEHRKPVNYGDVEAQSHLRQTVYNIPQVSTWEHHIDHDSEQWYPGDLGTSESRHQAQGSVFQEASRYVLDNLSARPTDHPLVQYANEDTSSLHTHEESARYGDKRSQYTHDGNRAIYPNPSAGEYEEPKTAYDQNYAQSFSHQEHWQHHTAEPYQSPNEYYRTLEEAQQSTEYHAQHPTGGEFGSRLNLHQEHFFENFPEDDHLLEERSFQEKSDSLSPPENIELSQESTETTDFHPLLWKPEYFVKLIGN